MYCIGVQQNTDIYRQTDRGDKRLQTYLVAQTDLSGWEVFLQCKLE